jgi:type III secretory pathway component EscR
MNELIQHLHNLASQLQEYKVVREVESIPMKGYFPFSIQHSKGQPAQFFVNATSQKHAEDMVDEWLNS